MCTLMERSIQEVVRRSSAIGQEEISTQLVDNINVKYKLIIELGYQYLPQGESYRRVLAA